MTPLAWALRDALLPLVWAHAWLSDRFEWRGSTVHPVESGAHVLVRR
jgi:ceramide glucosyltransferase